MARTTIDHLIINSPYEELKHYWSYDRESRTFDQKDGRRPAGYVIASQSSKAFDDPGIFVEIPLVNQIPPRVKLWRESSFSSASWKRWKRSSGWPKHRRPRKSASTSHWAALRPVIYGTGFAGGGVQVPSRIEGGVFRYNSNPLFQHSIWHHSTVPKFHVPDPVRACLRIVVAGVIKAAPLVNVLEVVRHRVREIARACWRNVGEIFVERSLPINMEW